MAEAKPLKDGVDITLIRWMLSLTPAERLKALEEYSNDMLRMLEFAKRAKDASHPPRAQSA